MSLPEILVIPDTPFFPKGADFRVPRLGRFDFDLHLVAKGPKIVSSILWILFSGGEALDPIEASRCLIDINISFPSDRRICRHRNRYFIRSIITTIRVNGASRPELDWRKIMFGVITTGRFGMVPSAKETFGDGMLEVMPVSSKMGFRDSLVPFFECGSSISLDDHEKRRWWWYPVGGRKKKGKSPHDM